VNQAITQMDEVTQQNAALVEEAAAAAESLQEQAQTLLESVSVFRLGTEDDLLLVPELRTIPAPPSISEQKPQKLVSPRGEPELMDA
jgi:hypothetical protein